MIKKYIQFINENLNDIRRKYNTVGEYVERLSENDDYALNIISQYTKDIDSDVRISSAINTLDEDIQLHIVKMIEDHKNGTEDNKNAEVISYTDANLSESNESGGKNLFKCYLKVFTALGFKDTKINWDQTPDDFLMFFISNQIDISNVKMIMSRYRQFDMTINSMDYKHNECQLYYGIKCDGTLQYGIKTEDQNLVVGGFKINKGIFNWLLVLDSPSASNMKRELILLDINKLLLLCKIKNEVKKFNPGQTEKRSNPSISSDIMTFGYYGLGRWNNGKMESDDLDAVKNNFRIFLSKYKWVDKIQISVTANQFWTYLNIKIK